MEKVFFCIRISTFFSSHNSSPKYFYLLIRHLEDNFISLDNRSKCGCIVVVYFFYDKYDTKDIPFLRRISIFVLSIIDIVSK